MEKINANCSYCGEEVKNHATNIKKHLKSCKGIIAHAETMSTADYLLLKVNALYGAPHWLLLKAHPNISLEELDGMLRHGWLECCGHLSQFNVQLKGYYKGLNEEATLGQIFAEHDSIEYTYDFGSSTELQITKIGMETLPNDGNLVLILRNVALEFNCADCGAIAVLMCEECTYENENPFRCKKCAKKHEKVHGELEGMDIVNSPRMGVCAYSGPAKFDKYLPKKKEEKPKSKPKKLLDDIYKEMEDDFFDNPFGDDDEDEEMRKAEFFEMMQSNPEMMQGIMSIKQRFEEEVLFNVVINTARLLEHYVNIMHRALGGLPEEDFFAKHNKHTHSIAEILNHLSMHIKARYTNPFDGDLERHRKPEKEFDVKGKSLQNIFDQWNEALAIYFHFIENLKPEELMKSVVIAGEEAPLFIRINSGLAHYNYHIGQIIHQAKSVSPEWEELFAPPTKSVKKEAKEININDKKKKK